MSINQTCLDSDCNSIVFNYQTPTEQVFKATVTPGFNRFLFPTKVFVSKSFIPYLIIDNFLLAINASRNLKSDYLCTENDQAIKLNVTQNWRFYFSYYVISPVQYTVSFRVKFPLSGVFKINVDLWDMSNSVSTFIYIKAADNVNTNCVPNNNVPAVKDLEINSPNYAYAPGGFAINVSFCLLNYNISRIEIGNNKMANVTYLTGRTQFECNVILIIIKIKYFKIFSSFMWAKSIG